MIQIGCDTKTATLHKLLKADTIFGMYIIGLSKTCHYYRNVWACVIERNGKWGHAKNDHRSHIKGKQLQQTNNVLITSKAGTWELLINYFKQHYGNERTAAGNLKWALLPIITQWVKWPGIKSTRNNYQIIQEVLYQQWFRWHGRGCIVCWTLWQIWHWLWWTDKTDVQWEW